MRYHHYLLTAALAASLTGAPQLGAEEPAAVPGAEVEKPAKEKKQKLPGPKV